MSTEARSAFPHGRVEWRQAFEEMANGLRGIFTAPSDVDLGGARVPPPPPRPAPPTPQRAWRPIGPFAIPHGQSKGGPLDARFPVAGRISALVVDPSDPSHLLAGAGGGGIWESRDAGGTWDPRTDDQPSLAIGAIAFDPANPQIVYAGTGEGDSIYYLGAGLLRSGDGGRTWAMHNATFAGDAFFALAIDPENPARMLAGTRTGLWLSTASGAGPWTRLRAHTTWSISFHPAVPGVPGASREVFAACDDGLFLSTDGGATFPGPALAVPGQPPSLTRLAVAHAPSAPDVVWVAGAGTTPPAPAVAGFIARRGGPPPAGLAAAGIPANAQYSGGATWGQAVYDWVLGVAPDNADTVYLGTIDLWRIDRNAVTGACAFTLVSQRPGDAIHSDQHALAFVPAAPGTVYVGNDGGVFRTRDRGLRWEALNRGLAILEIEYLAQHPQVDAWLLAGTQDNGTERYEGAGAWFHVADGDGGDCAVDDDHPSTVYHEYFAVRNRQAVHNERSRVGGAPGTPGDSPRRRP